MVPLEVLSPPALTGILKLPKPCFDLSYMCVNGSNTVEGTSQVEVNLATFLGALLCIQLADNGFITIASFSNAVPYWVFSHPLPIGSLTTN